MAAAARVTLDELPDELLLAVASQILMKSSAK